MQRLYYSILKDHLERYDQMLFLAGPRQVGKTTTSVQAKTFTEHYKRLNWDNLREREQILEESNLVKDMPLYALLKHKPILVLDEIHKYVVHWQILLKGMIDEYKGILNVIVTGSCKLDVYRKGGDSLMGRYLLYRIHPISVAELVRTKIPTSPISLPQKIEQDSISSLLEFGGFPEPFIKQDKRFYNRWQLLRKQQILKEDIRDITLVHEVSQLELLASLLGHQAGQLVNYSNLSIKVRTSDQTIRRWVSILESCYYCFIVRPWARNISRSLIKEPKIYMWDWSIVKDKGARIENFIASHLLKAVHLWNDLGLGDYELYYLRNKDKREVDFVVVKDNKPWFLVEVKASYKAGLSESLYYYQAQTGATHAFQVVFDLEYVEKDCFEYTSPIIVPASTFLSQLV